MCPATFSIEKETVRPGPGVTWYPRGAPGVSDTLTRSPVMSVTVPSAREGAGRAAAVPAAEGVAGTPSAVRAARATAAVIRFIDILCEWFNFRSFHL
ncbi:hypothetical protein Skr01_26090 [Sphaerisporangium krabiense]|nr:hypothetical protein Skr01_26090 [Sphaerisporangium krabiense]